MPGFLSFYLGADEPAPEGKGMLGRAGRGIAVGLVLSGSFSAVFIIAGLAVTAGLRSVLQVLPWVAFAVGLCLVGLGAVMLSGRQVRLLPAVRIRPGMEGGWGYRRVATFGVAYALASLSCTLAVFLVVVSQALAVSGLVQTLAVFAAYAAGSASILLALSLSAALAKGAMVRAVRRITPVVSRLSGALLFLSGAYLILYWLPALGGGTPSSESPVAQASTAVTSTLATFFSAHTAVFAGLLIAVLALGLSVAVSQRMRKSRVATTDGTG